MNQSSLVNQKIKNIIFILSSAFILALLGAIFLIYHFGPSGRYVAGYTLLAPQVIEEINQYNLKEKVSSKNYFRLDSIKFSYFNQQQKKIQQQDVPIKDYKSFYDLVAKEKSIDQTEQLSLSFLDVYPSILTITKQANKEAFSTHQDFQIVQFKDNYFRVQLHDSEKRGEWAYFYYPDLSSVIFKLFVSL